MSKRDLNCDWQKYYKDHLVTVEEAAKHIEPGDVIFLGNSTCIPYELLNYLYDHKEDYHDVTFFYNVTNVPSNMFLSHDSKEHFRLINMFNLPLDRMAMDEHAIEVCSAGYDQLGIAFAVYGGNTAASHFCPPDEDGWCNVGTNAIATHHDLTQSPKVVKKFGFIDSTGVYPSPGSHDTHCIHITEFDYIIESDTQMMGMPVAEPTPFDKRIASYIIPYIHSGDKVQIGFGGLGEEILRNMKNIPGTFEIYSEVMVESVIELVESGKITKVTASSPSASSEQLYKYIASHPDKVKLLPREDCVEPLTIMQQDNIISINASFMCDLIGQCCSEAQGLKPYTGAGGSFAYIYGAQRAKGGRSFICLRSTFKDANGERQSNIVPWLPAGCMVTTPKNYVMYIVSEWGLADVYCRTYTDRIKALIKIAHPDYREWLKEQILTTPLIEEWDFRELDLFDNVDKNS